MRIVTSGFRYLDIDAYGGCAAYAELLHLQGIEAVFASTAPLNESITPTIRSWVVPMERSYTPNEHDEYVIIDLSEPKIFDTFVAFDRVVEVIDHHMEMQEYWRSQSKVSAQIEFVGAACTLVYERWCDAGLLDQMSQVSARLLIAGMLDNTLNFKASVTDQRDRDAYESLMRYAHLPADWPATYFTECQQTIEKDVMGALRNDTKQAYYPGFTEELTVAQLATWDARFILDQPEVVSRAMPPGSAWFASMISISEGKNYLICQDEALRRYLDSLLGVKFDKDIGVTDRLWLRKEIMKKAMEQNI